MSQRIENLLKAATRQAFLDGAKLGRDEAETLDDEKMRDEANAYADTVGPELASGVAA